jgi:hypothetical protein
MKKKESTRRDFLKKTVTTAAGAALFPMILPAASKWRGANDKINVLHIGVGSRGYNTIRNYFFKSNDLRSVAVCDVFKSRREKAAAMVNTYYKDLGTSVNCKAYLDFEEALERSDIDAVHIATGDYWHVPMSYKSVAAGKHIYVEKPLGLSLENYIKLEEIIKKQGVKFHYGTQQRSQVHMQMGIEMIRSGRIGDIERLDIWAPKTKQVPESTEIKSPPADLDYDRWLGPAPKKPYCEARVANTGTFHIYDYGLGFISVWGAHPLDIAVWGMKEQMAEPGTFAGKGSFFDPSSIFNTVYDWDVDIQYSNGLKVRYFSDNLGYDQLAEYLKEPEGNGTTFFGAKGWISLGRNHAISNIPEIQKELSTYMENDTSNLHAVNFAKIVKGEQPELCPLDDAIISDSISHMGDIAIRTGDALEWDVKKKQITNHPEYIKEYFYRKARKGYGI